jgi:hypothetical protein
MRAKRHRLNPSTALRGAPPLLIGIAGFLGACAGSGAGLDANGNPLAAGGAADAPLTADFASIQDHVFSPICSVCHAGGGAPQGLRLDAANSYTLLVGVPSTEVPSILRVRPGDPDNSYLIQKLEGHASVGAQMPFGGPPLTADVIAVIRQWISDGAQRAAAAASSMAPGEAFRITSIAPAPGDLLVASPPQVLIGFNHEIDANSVTAGSVRVEREVAGSGPSASDPAAAELRNIPVRTQTLATNPHALMVTPLSSMPPGHYRVVTRGDMAILDLGGHAAGPGDLVTEFDIAEAP